MRCPVCNEDIKATDKCPYCGFDQLNKTFANKEEAIIWKKKVVIPYREKHLFSDKSFATAKRRMIHENTNIARRNFYEGFAKMVDNHSWVHAPVNDKQLLILPFRGGYYISIYSDMNNRRQGESRDVIVADINIFIDSLFDNPHLLGIVVDPNHDPVLISRREINDLTVRKDPRLQIKNWGAGIPDYSEKDRMVEEELLDFGIDVIEEHFINKNGFEILEINRGTEGFPNFALRKNGILYLMKVDAAVTNKPTLTREKREFYVNTCRRFNAKCLYAPLALIPSDPERAKAGLALCGDGFYPGFSGVEVLN